MNRSIWILNRIIEFSVQAVSILSELDAGRFCDETGHWTSRRQTFKIF